MAAEVREEQFAAWMVDVTSGGRISITVSLLDGTALRANFTEADWVDLKCHGDHQMLIAKARLKHGVGQ